MNKAFVIKNIKRLQKERITELKESSYKHIKKFPKEDRELYSMKVKIHMREVRKFTKQLCKFFNEVRRL